MPSPCFIGTLACRGDVADAHDSQPRVSRRARASVPQAHTSLRSATRPPSPNSRQHGKHSGRAPDYHANVGSVIETLRRDYPNILTQPPDMDIYTDNILFRDGVNFDLQGKDAYSSFFWALRFHAKIFFHARHSRVEITSLFHNDAEGLLYLRWRVRATPRFASPENEFIYDGMSLYKIDDCGWVYQHVWDNSAHHRGTDIRPIFERILRLGKVPSTVGAGAGVGAGLTTHSRARPARNFSPRQSNTK